jgi:hypothetical protein
MDNDSLRHRHKKHKHKHGRKHDRKRDKRRHHDSESDLGSGAEEQPPPSQLQLEPWHGMQFELVDGIGDYGMEAPASRCIRGLAPAIAPNSFDMSDFVRLMGYVRNTFDLDPELSIELVASVRGRLARARPRSLANCSLSEQGVLGTGTCHHRRDDAGWLSHELPHGGACGGARAYQGAQRAHAAWLAGAAAPRARPQRRGRAEPRPVHHAAEGCHLWRATT